MQLCRSCRRHVKTTPCPFCGSTLAQPTLGSSPGRRSRAQMLAGAALLGAVSAACGDDEPSLFALYGGPPDQGASSTSGAAIYGGPPAQDAAPDADRGGSSGAIYGGPPVDAGEIEDATPDAADEPDSSGDAGDAG